MKTAHHRPRTTRLAIRVNHILTTVNRRYARAYRPFNATGDHAAWIKALYHFNASQAREAALLALLPERLSDDDLARIREEVDEEIGALSEMVAEDTNEAALYGDGPCGSLVRRHALIRAESYELALREEWQRRQPAPIREARGYASQIPAIDNFPKP